MFGQNPMNNYRFYSIPSLILRELSSSVQACMYTCEGYLHGILPSKQLEGQQWTYKSKDSGSKKVVEFMPGT